jgi:hypothetical protein
MSEANARNLATEALIAIFDGAANGTNQQLEATLALGRVGGVRAAKKLLTIYNAAAKGPNLQLATIKALGEVGRVP